jgi:prepilin-type N-terminal cleavage/methylation domain-containing protein/prepilin-type processing-associated H-X9-DG protein
LGKRGGCPCTRGFSLIELLVAIAIIAVLAALLLPSLSRAKAQGQNITCLSNLKQLQLGYRMYSDDNHDWLAPNISRMSYPNQVNVTGAWVLGNVRIDTNTANIQAGTLFQYLRSPAAYSCPADNSIVAGLPGLRRTRSYSIQMWLNSDLLGTDTPSDVAVTNSYNLRRYAQLLDPGPSKTWVFTDEHEQTIDDGVFIFGNPWAFPGVPDFWTSYPGDRHNNGGNLSFADGHVEHHSWRYHRTNVPTIVEQVMITNEEDRKDLKWLQQWIPHTPGSGQPTQ